MHRVLFTSHLYATNAEFRHEAVLDHLCDLCEVSGFNGPQMTFDP